MKINLLRDYCGRIISDRVLRKGIQDVDDSVGAYLVGKGYAVDVTPAIPQAVDIDLDALQAQGEITATHDDGSTSTVSIVGEETETVADVEYEPLPEIDEATITEERISTPITPKPKGKR
jgi:hypothetical protein